MQNLTLCQLLYFDAFNFWQKKRINHCFSKGVHRWHFWQQCTLMQNQTHNSFFSIQRNHDLILNRWIQTLKRLVQKKRCQRQKWFNWVKGHKVKQERRSWIIESDWITAMVKAKQTLAKYQVLLRLWPRQSSSVVHFVMWQTFFFQKLSCAFSDWCHFLEACSFKFNL